MVRFFHAPMTGMPTPCFAAFRSIAVRDMEETVSLSK